MNILITGGTGYIGQHFIKRYQDQYQFDILTRNTKKVAQKNCRYIDKIAPSAHYHIIINLAGEPIADKRWSKKQKEIICQSRWQITEDLVDFIQQTPTPPQCFLSGSAIGFYSATGKVAATETTQASKHDFPHEVCDKWEKIAQKATPYCRVVNLRTGVVLGKNSGALAKLLPIFKLGLGGPISHGKQMMSWIHIDDMVAAMAHCIVGEHIKGAVNFTSPTAVSNRDFSQALATALHRPAWFPVPASMLKIMMGESACLVLENQKVVPEKLTKSGFAFQYSDINKALAAAVK